MGSNVNIIKAAMERRGYRHRRADHQFTIKGQYVRHLQYVYSRDTYTNDGLVIDLLYFAVDMRDEKLVIGFYRENSEMENGVYANTSRSLNLFGLTAEDLEEVLDKLIPPMRQNL